MEKNQTHISEDEAIRDGVLMSEYLQGYLDEGYEILSSYRHPAVGKCYILQNPIKEERMYTLEEMKKAYNTGLSFGLDSHISFPEFLKTL